MVIRKRSRATRLSSSSRSAVAGGLACVQTTSSSFWMAASSVFCAAWRTAILAAFSAFARRFSTVSRSASRSSVLMMSMSCERVDVAGDVDDFGVMEAADHVQDRVGLADVREELVAQAFALAGAFDDAGDVDELHGGGDDGVRLDHGRRCGPCARRERARCRRWGRWCRRGSSRPAALEAVSALKMVHLPTLGRPTIPTVQRHGL